MNGKGDKPRNNYSKDFRDNYDNINWKDKNKCKFVDSIDGCPACGAEKEEDCADLKSFNGKDAE